MEERRENKDGLQAAVAYLRRALPEADRMMCGDEMLESIARHALMVRGETPWGYAIPEELFRAYVLFPRVNNEDLTLYQPPLWAALCDRVRGKSMRDAILEVNLWCCEHATYRATDDRTLNALSVLRRGFGRCGEESTLLVSALRAVGIPARQVYVPRWAHCDDNHAWVEAWADGAWHYLGACEPEPELDSGWFTAAASKAMLVHTHAYGVVPAGERIEKTEDGVCTINRTAAYARTALLTARVMAAGKPCPGLTVRFELANEGEFFPILEKTTDAGGCATFLTGLGTLRLHVHDGARFVTRMVEVRGETQCEVDFSAASGAMAGPEVFAQRPPEETRIQPFLYAREVAEAHRARLAACQAERAAREAALPKGGDTGRARGDHEVIEVFLALPQYAEADKRALLDMLREKDLADATLAMLTDALDAALPYRAAYPPQVWRESVLCPRVADEMLYPVRKAVVAWFGTDAPKDAQALRTVLEANVARRQTTGARIVPDAYSVLKAGACPAYAWAQVFVSIARALGIAARLDPLTAGVECWSGGAYRALTPARQANAALTLVNEAGRELRYGPDFTVGVLENGAYRTLRPREAVLRERWTLAVPGGEYRVMMCTRQIDGAIDGMLTPVSLRAGEEKLAAVRMAPEHVADKLIDAVLPPLRAQTPAGKACHVADTVAGRAIVAFIAPGEEPTEHFLNELLAGQEDLRAGHVAVRLLLRGEADLRDERLAQVLAQVGDAQALCGASPEDELAWRRTMRAGDLRLPFATSVSAEGRGLFSFVNYHVGSVKALLKTLDGR